MAIDRYQLVSRHNPRLTEADDNSPLSVGNGNFAFTADVTGMQTLYEEYQALPLCTMAQWGWHTKPVSKERYAYTLQDVEMTEYPHCGKTVRYAVEKKPGNEEVYDWLRQNPHKMNLARIRLIKNGKSIKLDQIREINQELHLYEGILESSFQIEGKVCRVKTAISGIADVLAFEVETDAWADGLAVEVDFPYGSPDISASDWNAEELHRTECEEVSENIWKIYRTLDRNQYTVGVILEHGSLEKIGKHQFVIQSDGSQKIGIVFCFAKGKSDKWVMTESEQVMGESREYWKHFWQNGGVIDLHQSKDSRAMELERRIVLSQYLLAIQSSGNVPPQETGLTCNSWYGKAHLEMYFWHEAYLPLWNHTDLLERSLQWYQKHLKEAKIHAARNGYKGAKWPKMVAEDGLDSPSPIATLLVWQQPHIIYMLEMAYQNKKSQEFLVTYYDLVEETAEFMVDFAVYNPERQLYELREPLIPVQENHDPMVTRNPAFELEYWVLTLKIAAQWAKRLGKEVPLSWIRVAEHMAEMTIRDEKYLTHENCPDTYSCFNQDHPSMLCSFGVIDSGRIDQQIMENSLYEVEKCWDYASLWGWDFAVMAMTAVRLGKSEYALDLLLMDTYKNRYVKSGNNFQEGRPDLPLYLPGNGSLLLAVALMTAGYPGSGELPGFPKDGTWTVEFEGIQPFCC